MGGLIDSFLQWLGIVGTPATFGEFVPWFFRVIVALGILVWFLNMFKYFFASFGGRGR